MGAFDTFSDLVQAIGDELARDDLDQVIPRWIALVEAELSRDLDIREQEAQFGGTFSSDLHVDMPSDALWVRHISIETNPIRFVSIVSMKKLNDVKENLNNQQPTAAAFVGGKLLFAPSVTAGTRYTITYMQALPPLSPENPTNETLARAPDVIFYGALVHSAPYVGDDQRLQVWMLMYEKAKDSYKKMEWRARTGAGQLRIRPDRNPNDSHDWRNP